MSKTLRDKAKKIRLDILDLSKRYQNGHIASALSCVEILVLLYEHVMTSKDQFILSKGHGVLALYAVLMDKGFHPHISGHPDIEPEQGIVCTTGSLGHGLGIALGKALAKKIQNEEGKIFVLLGDGECQEGSIWESLNLIRKFQLDNMIMIVDHNGFQALDTIQSILDESNLKQKFEAFGMSVWMANGHDFESLEKAITLSLDHHQPSLVLAHSVKGKGISFMEHIPCWHSRMMSEEEMERARGEIRNVGF